MSNLKDKLKNTFLSHESLILAIAALILTGVVAFQAGKSYAQPATIDVKVVKAEANQSNPAKKSPSEAPKSTSKPAQSQPAEVTGVEPAKQPEGSPSGQNQPCAFVASKNSTKYHLSDCKNAQKISQENRVCFASKEEAAKQGYEPAKCCNP